MFWILKRVFGFWEVFLDSGTCFWILGRVLDSGKSFGFWEVFWILGRVLDFGKCFLILGRVMDSGKCFIHTRHCKNTTQITIINLSKLLS